VRGSGVDGTGCGGGDGLGADGAAGGVHGQRPASQQQLDAEARVVHLEAGVLGLAQEHVLGERRAVVGRVRLRADQGQPALEAALPKSERGLHSGDPGPDHDDPLHHRLSTPTVLEHPVTVRRGARLQWERQSREPGVPG
jgi:hypothetical protein